ncbi:glycosyltransferase family 4 protein [Sulfurovum sp. TSL1]|uniref:glycosyltransferase family 4 protein n=1 Tax=Sulfurovum sp. TSL1 TaxID=2826994 RepID=UPI001CC82E00|nr:MraY family glycosyltransferase [Sulfurovum sp. TSL1]GIT98121.1 putative undecaprenyl-phosphate N-acetylglucosaminyl 1-phosphate transferase [Sulfurovum sp. TSL1]
MYLVFVGIFILSLVFVGLVKHYAADLGLIDVPNERSIHRNNTPRGAGIGFYLAIAFVLPVFYFDVILSYTWTCTAILLVFIVGLLDDHRDTSPNTKFFVIMLSTVLFYFDNIVVDHLGTFFGFEFSLGWFALPFTLFAVVGFTNALNLIDGLDGLAATVSIVILGSFFAVGTMHDDLFMMIMSGAFISALLGFLVFNWHPSSIFMGDSGSLTLGFTISILAIKSLAYLPTVSILFIAAIPILDTVVVMVRRKIKGKSMFCADRCHIHHILRHFFAEDTRKTVLFLGVFQTIYSLTGLQLERDMDEGVLLILFVLNVVLLYMFLAAMIKRQKRDC